MVDSILARGLLPRSAIDPNSHTTQSSEFFEHLYQVLAEPLLQRPYTGSGLFFTPIDFRVMSGTPIASLPRLSVPVAALDASRAVLTYELDGVRQILPLSPETLAEAAAIWTERMVRQWFGRDPHQIFYYLPQVAVYQEEGIAISPDWVETI